MRAEDLASTFRRRLAAVLLSFAAFLFLAGAAAPAELDEAESVADPRPDGGTFLRTGTDGHGRTRVFAGRRSAVSVA